MTSTLPMRMFLGAPIELDPPDISLPGLSVLIKLFVLVSILALGALFWGGLAWLGLNIDSILTGSPTAYMEAIDPVRSYYYLGWGKQGI
ncbi:MAG: hypothetical protein QNI91_16680 [Arenicellales bacterium]|nr:hypothetical protein [Arenicellales bacterium]